MKTKVKKQKKHNKLFYFFKYLFLTLFIILGSIVLSCYIVFVPEIKSRYKEIKQLVNKDNANNFRYKSKTIIVDDVGQTLITLGNMESDYIEYKDIPKSVVNAFITIEDQTFWKNDGYDPKGMMRVCINYLKSKGEEMHGASTITQQLARAKYLSNEISIDRKINEIMYAKALTEKYSKKQIMEFYVNNCCYSNNIYGIKSAAKIYFNKNVNELNLSQIAYLCALPNSPTRFNPYNDVQTAMPRRDKILKDMYKCKYITKEEKEEALAYKIEIIPKTEKTFSRNYETTYALNCSVEYIMKQNNFEFKNTFTDITDYNNYIQNYNNAYKDAKDELSKGGYVITTSLNANIQKETQDAIDVVLSFDNTMNENNNFELQGAVTVIDNFSKKVVAIVGGRTENVDSYRENRAFQSYRQPGSSIKPLIVYAPAIMQGYTDKSYLHEISVANVKKGKKISNMSGKSYTMRNAVTWSRNGCAIELLNKITPEYGTSFLHQMNFGKILRQDDTSVISALGGFTYGTNTTEMAAAYRSLAMNGIYSEATCITSIKKDGKEIYKEPEEKQVYTSESAKMMTNILQDVVTKGTASSMNWKNVSSVLAAGKTGTTNDNKDGWFCGYTPYYSIAVYVGYDNPKTIDGLMGGTYPAEIWKYIMSRIVSGKENEDYSNTSFYNNDNVSLPNLNTEEEIMPGHDDNEIISKNYTVGNLRKDTALENQIKNLANQYNNSSSESEKRRLKEEMNNCLEEIYGINATNRSKKIINNLK